MAFTAKEIEKLIQLIKNTPAIYDRAHLLHNNLTYIKDEWIKIAEEMNLPEKKVRDKWKNLRDSYRIQLYKKPDFNESGGDDSAESRWPYYQNMSFLEQHMLVRSKPGINLKTLKRENDHSYVEDADTTNKDYRENFQSIEMVTVDDFDSSVIENINYSSSENYTKKQCLMPLNQNDQDEDKCFFDSLIPYMKRLSPKEKLICRMKIQEIIFDVAFPRE